MPGQVQVFDPHIHRLESPVYTSWVYLWVKAYLEAGCRVLVVQVHHPAYSPRLIPRRGVVMTCASTIAYLLGIECFAITPRQLWRALKRHGAEEVKL